MTYDDLDHLLKDSALRILGGFLTDPARDSDLAGYQTLLMIGPDEPAFWPVFKVSEEFQAPKDPMDKMVQTRSWRDSGSTERSGVFPLGRPTLSTVFLHGH